MPASSGSGPAITSNSSDRSAAQRAIGPITLSSRVDGIGGNGGGVCPRIATLPGLPSTAIPTGFAPDGLPVGVQIVGPWLEDRTPLKLAELIEREFGGFVPPPMFDD